MRGHGAKFSRKMEEAVAALLTQKNHEEAARVVRVGTATLLRWQKLPEFQTALRRARRDAYSQSIAWLQQASSAPVSTLLKTMIDATTPPATKVRAADSVLGHAAKAIEMEDIQARVSALERAVEESKSRREEGR
jgi:hypothetical protein